MKKRMDLHAAENRVIYLGKRGENLANTIEIDASPMRKEFPECTFLLMVQRPGESSAYSATITTDGNIVSWPLTNADTGIAGDGCAEMRAMVGDTIAKTALFRTHIDESMNLPQEETPPAPQKGWLDQALAAQVKAEEAAQSAKNSADTAEATVNAVIDKATAATLSATQAATNANSAAQTAQTVADTVQTKLDNGDFVGPAGKDGEKGPKGDTGATGPQGAPGSDAEVTAENIKAALGYAPAKVSKSTSWGIINNVNSEIALNPASKNTINSRETRQPITPGNFDYAVKAAMCDGKGAAWTDAEQKAARERMGVDKPYELIEEITISERTRLLERTLEPDGTAYNFRKVYVNITTPQAEEDGFVYFTCNDVLVGLAIGSILTSPSAGGIAQLYARIENGLLDGYGVGEQNVGASSSLMRYVNSSLVPSGVSVINRIKIRSTVDIPVNSHITIYGVRA